MSPETFNPCIVIPNYNHSEFLPGLLDQIKSYDMDTIVVDDGSQTEHQKNIEDACIAFDRVALCRLNENQGKGGAVMAGMQEAFDRGFSHAIQIDADGQHDIKSLKPLLGLAQNNPQDLISGCPVYDEDVPLGRKIGRYITHIWVWIETLSFQIKDTMCGFRAYPLSSCIPLIQRVKFGRHMDFDIEIMVRFFWLGKKVRHLPVRVQYPEDGKSHFNLYRDNVRITKMHTKLFFGMLLRFPLLMLRKITKPRQAHWSKIGEAGSIFGMKFLLGMYSLLGRPVLRLVLFPVSFYYYLFNHKGRRASREYLKTYQNFCLEQGITPQRVSSYNHIYQFASMILDKLAAWKGDIKVNDLEFPNQDKFHEMAQKKQGMVFFTSHFGNIEVCRALSVYFPDLKINILAYTENAKKINAVIEGVNKKALLNVFSLNQFGLETAIILRGKIENGEWIFIKVDRTSASQPDKFLRQEFLGRSAKFPLGALILADVLRSPIFSMHCYRKGKKFIVRTKEFEIPKSSREDRLKSFAAQYARELEYLITEAPLQWFNFFNFWDESK